MKKIIKNPFMWTTLILIIGIIVYVADNRFEYISGFDKSSNVYEITPDDEIYKEVSGVAKMYFQGLTFKPHIVDKVLYNSKNEIYDVYISELNTNDSQTYEEAVKQHYENFNGHSPFSISVKYNKESAGWNILKVNGDEVTAGEINRITS